MKSERLNMVLRPKHRVYYT